MEREYPACARCPFALKERLCSTPLGKALPSCPTPDTFLLEKAQIEFENQYIRELARQASIQEGEGYRNRGPNNACPSPAKPRLLETVEFAEKMGFRKLGLAFCTGLSREAKIVEGFLSEKGFEVVSVICKAGRILKEDIGVKDSEKIIPGTDESMCNPVFQAMVLNKAETEFNIMMGLCVGHDSLFLKYSDALCTVLAAKDRMSAHNPLAAVYTLESYYRYLKED
ncbi:MAG: DUF1847 domain-containing protein [Candidatus Aegiribacteria sp.]|nr:DUF1847 domain-containing protein [Candidatus Aegiribacteria sp.]